jgi:hypothetical protein
MEKKGEPTKSQLSEEKSKSLKEIEDKSTKEFIMYPVSAPTSLNYLRCLAGTCGIDMMCPFCNRWSPFSPFYGKKI